MTRSSLVTGTFTPQANDVELSRATANARRLQLGVVRPTQQASELPPETSTGREPLEGTRAPFGIVELHFLICIRGEHSSPERNGGTVARRLRYLPHPRMALNHQVRCSL